MPSEWLVANPQVKKGKEGNSEKVFCKQ